MNCPNTDPYLKMACTSKVKTKGGGVSRGPPLGIISRTQLCSGSIHDPVLNSLWPVDGRDGGAKTWAKLPTEARPSRHTHGVGQPRSQTTTHLTLKNARHVTPEVGTLIAPTARPGPDGAIYAKDLIFWGNPVL